MNAGTNSGDMIVHATMFAEGMPANQIWYTTDGSDPRFPGGSIHDDANGGTARVFTDDIVVETTTEVRTRSRSFEGTWSALNEAYSLQIRPCESLKSTTTHHRPRNRNWN